MKTSLRSSSLILGAALLALSHHGYAQTISMQTADGDSSAYWYTASNITFVTGGTGAAFGGQGHIICIEDDAHAPPEEAGIRTYTMADSAAIFRAPGGAVTGENFINWVVDHYYEDIFLNPEGSSSANSSDFQRAIWELGADFNGTSSSIDLYHGDYWPEVSNPIINALHTNYNTIAAGYTSKDFSIHYLTDNESEFQNMVLITPVPEPSGALLFGFTGALALLRRKRSA